MCLNFTTKKNRTEMTSSCRNTNNIRNTMFITDKITLIHIYGVYAINYLTSVVRLTVQYII